MIAALAVIGGLVVAAWLVVGLLLVRVWYLNRAWNRVKAARHADVDALARRAKALSSRRTSCEEWHTVPTPDELGI